MSRSVELGNPRNIEPSNTFHICHWQCLSCWSPSLTERLIYHVQSCNMCPDSRCPNLWIQVRRGTGVQANPISLAQLQCARVSTREKNCNRFVQIWRSQSWILGTYKVVCIPHTHIASWPEARKRVSTCVGGLPSDSTYDGILVGSRVAVDN